MQTSVDYETTIKQSLRMSDEAKIMLMKSKLESIEILAETYLSLGKYHAQTLVAIGDMVRDVLRETR